MTICKIFGDYLLCGFDGLSEDEDKEVQTVEGSCGCKKEDDPYNKGRDDFIDALNGREPDSKIFKYRQRLQEMVDALGGSSNTSQSSNGSTSPTSSGGSENQDPNQNSSGGVPINEGEAVRDVLIHEESLTKMVFEVISFEANTFGKCKESDKVQCGYRELSGSKGGSCGNKEEFGQFTWDSQKWEYSMAGSPLKIKAVKRKQEAGLACISFIPVLDASWKPSKAKNGGYKFGFVRDICIPDSRVGMEDYGINIHPCDILPELNCQQYSGTISGLRTGYRAAAIWGGVASDAGSGDPDYRVVVIWKQAYPNSENDGSALNLGSPITKFDGPLGHPRPPCAEEGQEVPTEGCDDCYSFSAVGDNKTGYSEGSPAPALTVMHIDKDDVGKSADVLHFVSPVPCSQDACLTGYVDVEFNVELKGQFGAVSAKKFKAQISDNQCVGGRRTFEIDLGTNSLKPNESIPDDFIIKICKQKKQETTPCPSDCQDLGLYASVQTNSAGRKFVEIEVANGVLNGGVDCWTEGKAFNLTMEKAGTFGEKATTSLTIEEQTIKGDCSTGCTITLKTSVLPDTDEWNNEVDWFSTIEFCPTEVTENPTESGGDFCDGEKKKLFYVGKPHDFQVTPWNGKPSRNNEVSKYVYEASEGDGTNKRTATYADETYRCTRGDHKEEMVPPYKVGDIIQVRKLIGNSDDEESAHMPQSGEEDGDGEPKVMARFLVDETQRKWTDDCAADAGQGSIWV
jgi:hypothetical protein